MGELPTEASAATPGVDPTGPALEGGPVFSPGRILGDRYRILQQLGRGGMGDVWLAFDLKLKKDVALKSLRTDRFSDASALELLRAEVRSAHEVMSPNVSRIYDLVVEDGHELVSMEYVDGQTLTALLKARGPLDVTEAQPIASQFLAGLQAIHDAELVHRDIKPENVMVTRTNRVVIMDFGIAKGVSDDRSTTLTGTPAYMAPEQMWGEELDARTDLFAAGITLAEMVAPSGIADQEARQKIWQDAREDPPRLADGPWRRVLERAVAPDRENRFAAASELARALEEVTLRHDDADDKRPYPGLASFSAADARYFFGREAEVEQVWKKLQSSHMVALIGASGAGKSSFVQAGVIPAAPAGWHALICHPGSSPFDALERALRPALPSEAKPSQGLDSGDEGALLTAMRQWREQHTQVLLVLDQFEELFTLNTPEVQARFSNLLARLVLQADVHLLLSMRDDFFLRCHDHPALDPVFAEPMPLGPPTGAALRRALVQPALACGYRFEDESLVEEMLRKVGDERGALPLLAFAVASLWEQRDRERGLLTRAAYERIGGVAGALAQHADATLERIGAGRRRIVREIFRNLVTSQGTRSVIDFEELISVFDDPAPAREVLDHLVDSRLLTSFEVPTHGDAEQHEKRVEIVHESLLTSWPQLVRWRTQDADSAQLRDQLRQAAQAWVERNRSGDLLWTGAAFQEFLVWRERYSGGLTSTESAFAEAMIAKAEQQRRRRRRVIATVIVVLLAVAAGTTKLWQDSEVARTRAESETRNAAANHLHALGRLEIEQNPPLALAYATASLEIRDRADVRHFALEALLRGPTPFVLPSETGAPLTVDFSPDGRRLVVGHRNGSIVVWPDDGSAPKVFRDSTLPRRVRPRGRASFTSTGDAIVGRWYEQDQKLRIWSANGEGPPEGIEIEGRTLCSVSTGGRYLVTQSEREGGMELQVWGLEGGFPERLGRRYVDGMRYQDIWYSSLASVDPEGQWLAYAKGRELELLAIPEMGSAPARLLGVHDGAIEGVAFHPDGDQIATVDQLGNLAIWSRSARDRQPSREWNDARPYGQLTFSASGSALCVPRGLGDSKIFAPAALPGEDPIKLPRRVQINSLALHPGERWLATNRGFDSRPTLWYLHAHSPRVVRGHGAFVNSVLFSSDGSWLATASDDQTVRIWNLTDSQNESRVFSFEGSVWGLGIGPRSRRLVAWGGAFEDGAHLIDLDDGSVRTLPGGSVSGDVGFRGQLCAFDPTGRYVAASDSENNTTRVHDLETGEIHVLDAADNRLNMDLQFAPDGTLLVSGGGKLRRWNVGAKTNTVVLDGIQRFTLHTDGRTLLANTGEGRLRLYDLESGATQELSTHGNSVNEFDLDPTGTIVASCDRDGIIRVGPVSGAEPHLLLGHRGRRVDKVAIDPAGHWIASFSQDTELGFLLWPMPTGQPLHTLPKDEFLERLRSFTNVRIVADSTSATGYKMDIGEFGGWREVPTW